MNGRPDKPSKKEHECGLTSNVEDHQSKIRTSGHPNIQKFQNPKIQKSNFPETLSEQVWSLGFSMRKTGIENHTVYEKNAKNNQKKCKRAKGQKSPKVKQVQKCKSAKKLTKCKEAKKVQKRKRARKVQKCTKNTKQRKK